MENKKNMNLIASVVIVVIVIAVFVYLSMNNNPSNTNGSQSMPMNTDQSMNTTAAGQTSGAVTKVGDKITVAYTGMLADGTVFDSNIDPKFGHVQPFTFTLGAGQVIPGWDQGLIGMQVGEKRHLVIPPQDAYGANGYPPVIPPNATLTFDVQLTAIN